MNILIIGYGKMGHIVEDVLKERNHNVCAVLDKDDSWQDVDNKKIDCAICFTQPEAVTENIKECFKRHIPLVMGTTGWYDHLDKVKKQTIQEKQSFIWSANFSIGVYILRKMNIWLAQMMNNYKQYEPSITEVHHTHKIDAPSGTAIVLANELLENSDKKDSWRLNDNQTDRELKVKALRIGEEFGTHIIDYDSKDDVIEIAHKAKSRRGLAMGAVLAAEFLQGKKGFYTMNDMMENNNQ